ncbi:hypothetical protein [Caproiciproducens faecalis]|uniref:Uncharacterized protein n=1 Tax=Caproiciproducens faecalis TaxID=2820301 RepID=A0ABS7DJL0_9FIRM|nr:hypothetical protein [Caproiciproducens faecalis]MBW7571481.1 hypothetical protein [Caproiciproducens faecalis]
MKLFIKNHLFKMVACDQDGRPLYHIKGNPLSPKKVIAAKDKVLYCTDIISMEPHHSDEEIPAREYIVRKKSDNREPVITATVNYENSESKKRRNFPHKLPRAERLKVQIKDAGPSNMTIQRQKDGSCVFYNQQNQPVGTLSEYRPLRGYALESSFIADGGLLCALFVLTRYMAQEEELIVV